MTDSVLQFARDFEKLKSTTSEAVSLDQALLAMADFWPELREKRDNKSYASYFEEYVPLLVGLIDNDNLFDLTIAELKTIYSTLLEINDFLASDKRHSLENKWIETVALTLARLYFYSGNFEEGVAVVGKFLNEEIKIEITPEEIADKNELEIFRLICERASQESPNLFNYLNPILAAWEETRETIRQDRIICLFVEKDGSGRPYRGRLRALEGNVEPFGKSIKTDEITFDNQIKTPDDPFVGVAYDALKAVRGALKRLGPAGKADLYYHAHFSILGSKHTFTGDSIGSAFALLTYTQLMKPEISRLEKYLPADTAFTGGVDETGRLIPINDDTLRYKIERAFFSSLKYLALPQANYDSAFAILTELKTNYPHRQLRLITAETLAELIDNRNVIRSEKLCIGEFVAKKAYKYGRTTKIQVPLLIVILYALICIIYPKAWPWFDYHIYRIAVGTNEIAAINADGHKIWSNDKFDIALASSRYLEPDSYNHLIAIADVNNDKNEELVFVPYNPHLTGSVQLYDHNGTRLWERPTFVKTSYPGDVEWNNIKLNLQYYPPDLFLWNCDESTTFIITASFVSNPARTQFNVYNAEGVLVSGPYLNTGAAGMLGGLKLDLDGNGRTELIISACNNRSHSAGIAVLDPLNLKGVSPPYDNEYYIASRMPQGSQLYYVSLPSTPLCSEEEIHNNIHDANYDAINKQWEVIVTEGYNLTIGGKRLPVSDNLPRFYYSLDSNFFPIAVFIEDGSRMQFNQLLRMTNKQPVTNWSAFLDSLMREVIVYHGDSIVYHPAAGIIFKP